VRSDGVRPTTLEATNNGKTRSRGLGVRISRSGERERTIRLYRDVHGAEYDYRPTTVHIADTYHGDAAGDDDVLRRHWTVVCADRRGAAGG